MRKPLSALLAVAMLATSCGSADSSPGDAATNPLPAYKGPPVVLDYSPTVSDVGALIFLAGYLGDQLIGVTLAGTGESRCEPGVAHTRGVLEALNLGGVPVACGPEEAVGVLRAFPDEWRDAADNLDLPEAPPNETRSAPDLLNALAASSPRPIEVVAVGPLTNVAIALDAHPELADQIARITIMGGAVDVPGNVSPDIPGWETANGFAEANFWVDASAAARVFDSGIPLVLVPLDATNLVPTSRGFANALAAEPASPGAELLSAAWAGSPEWTGPGFYLWDELAAAIFADPSLADYETRTLVVEQGADDSAGRSREDAAGAPVRVAISADQPAFQQRFLTIVRGEAIEASPADEYFLAVSAAFSEHSAAQDAIFEATAADLGFDNSSPPEAWLEVLSAAAPRALDEAFPSLLAALESLTPPGELSDLHDRYVVAVRALVSNRGEFIEALEDAIAAGDLEGPLPYLEDLESACRALQSAATAGGAIVDLSCE